MKSWYVEYLVGMLLKDKGDHEDLTAPLLVIASVGKDDFVEKNIGRYIYEVSVTRNINSILIINLPMLGNWWHTKIYSNQENK